MEHGLVGDGHHFVGRKTDFLTFCMSTSRCRYHFNPDKGNVSICFKQKSCQKMEVLAGWSIEASGRRNESNSQFFWAAQNRAGSGQGYCLNRFFGICDVKGKSKLQMHAGHPIRRRLLVERGNPSCVRKLYTLLSY